MVVHRRIQNLVKHLTLSFLQNSSRFSAVNYFRKKLDFRCLTGFWRRYWVYNYTLSEKFLNTEFFLVRIFPHSDQKRLRIWTLFTQWQKIERRHTVIWASVSWSFSNKTYDHTDSFKFSDILWSTVFHLIRKKSLPDLVKMSDSNFHIDKVFFK